MRTPFTRAMTFVGLLLALAPAAVAQDISEARDLYASAAYEQALTVLEKIRQGNVATPEALLAVEQYRAYCLLALNRKIDAQQAIETVYTINPFFEPAEDEVAPWVRTAFKEGRRRALPSAVQRLYAQGKDALDRKAYGDAITRFKQVLTLIDDPDMPADKGTLVDYRPLAQGFLDLAVAASAAAPAKPADAPAQAAAPAPPVAAPGGAKPATEAPKGPAARIYGPSDTDVIPPVPIRQDMPRWPASYLPAGSPDGVIEVIVAETGAVESAVIRQSLNTFYDAQLLQAAKTWRYQPALKGGQAVKYRRLVKISFAGK
jgi:TonB family protein